MTGPGFLLFPFSASNKARELTQVLSASVPSCISKGASPSCFCISKGLIYRFHLNWHILGEEFYPEVKPWKNKWIPVYPLLECCGLLVHKPPGEGTCWGGGGSGGGRGLLKKLAARVLSSSGPVLQGTSLAPKSLMFPVL